MEYTTKEQIGYQLPIYDDRQSACTEVVNRLHLQLARNDGEPMYDSMILGGITHTGVYCGKDNKIYFIAKTTPQTLLKELGIKATVRPTWQLNCRLVRRAVMQNRPTCQP